MSLGSGVAPKNGLVRKKTLKQLQYKKFCAQKGVSGLIANLTVRGVLAESPVRSFI